MLEDNDDDDIDDDGDDDDNNNESFCPRWRQGRPLPALDGREVGLTLSSSSSMSSSLSSSSSLQSRTLPALVGNN